MRIRNRKDKEELPHKFPENTTVRLRTVIGVTDLRGLSFSTSKSSTPNSTPPPNTIFYSINTTIKVLNDISEDPHRLIKTLILWILIIETQKCGKIILLSLVFLQIKFTLSINKDLHWDNKYYRFAKFNLISNWTN